MALANFFDKSALAASQILKGYTIDTFKERLLNAYIEIAFDGHAIHSKEGQATLDLSLRLLARLYPNLVITALDKPAEEYKPQLTSLAVAINPLIEVVENLPLASIVIGETSVNRSTPTFYIGSTDWTVKFSIAKPVSSGNFHLPFAAGAAACFGVANVFRVVFGDQLPHGVIDSDFQLSLIDFTSADDGQKLPAVSMPLDLDDVIIVGLGAIGQGTLWALSNSSRLTGTVRLIDSETVDISNLQRYVLTVQDSIGHHKAILGSSCLKSTSLTTIPHEGDWASFVATLSDWKLSTILVAVDNAPDRIAIQAALPSHIINAWTQPAELGISRHFDFLNTACLACLYPPRQNQRRDSELIADALGLIDQEVQIRELIYNNAPVSQDWVERIATAKGVSIETLLPYCDLPIRDFYSRVICGGVVLTNGSNQQMETPMAFQSALAGILLASELIIHKASLRHAPIEATTRINLLRPIAPFLNDAVQKKFMGNCICQDADFRDQFSAKYC